jgi:hypothetical protein
MHEYVVANTYPDRTRAEPPEDGAEEVPAYEYPAPADD